MFEGKDLSKYVNNTGYLSGSQTETNPFNIIPSNQITMEGVDRNLLAIPVKDGIPQKTVSMKPRKNYNFDADFVIEIPEFQFGGGFTTPPFFPPPVESALQGAPNNLGLFAQQRSTNIEELDNNVVANQVGTGATAGANASVVTGANPRQAVSTVNTVQAQGLTELATPPIEANLDIDSLVNNDNLKTEQSSIDPLNLPENTNLQYFNPFGGVSLENSLFSFGQSLGSEGSTGNTIRGVGAAGKSLLNIGRIVGAGLGNANREKQTMEYYREQQRRALANSNFRNENGGLFMFFRDGGTVDELPPELALTGEFITGLPEHAEDEANAELEVKEYVKHPNGDVQQVVGRTHEQGGEKMNLESGTKIVSDNLKVGGDNAKDIRKEFDIKVSAKDTYARVIEKYTSKIGLANLVEKQKVLFEKLKKEEDNEDKSTNRLNTQFLSKQIKEVEDEKKELELARANFVDFIFTKQEEFKEKNGTPEQKDFFQNGGQITEKELKEINSNSDVQFTLEGAQRLFMIDDETSNKTPRNFDVDFGRFADVNYFELGNSTDKELRIRNTRDFPHNYSTMKTYVNELQKLNPKQKLKLDYINYQEKDRKMIEDQRFDELAKKHNMSKQEAMTLVDQFKSGGLKYHMQNGGNIGRLKDFYQQAVAAGYEGEIDFNSNNLGVEAGKLQRFLADKNPQAVIDYFRNGQPITSKGIDQIKKENATIFNELGLDGTKPSASFTPEERVKIQQKLDEKGGFTDEFIIDQFQDNRWDYRFPQIPLENQLAPAELVNPDITADIDIPVNANIEEPVVSEEEELVRGYRQRLGIPFLPDQSTLPPDALQPHLKINRRFERLDPVKISAEDNLKEINRQENLAIEQINNLPDSQRRAVLTNLTANSQENANQAITATNVANAQNFQQTEQFNIGQSNQEENARAVDALDFERRQLTALAKTQADLFNFFEFNRKVQLGNFNTVNRMNNLNSIYENFNVSPFGGIDFDSSKITEFYLNPTSKPASTTTNVSNN